MINRQTDQRTDRRTKQGVESHSTRLKKRNILCGKVIKRGEMEAQSDNKTRRIKDSTEMA